MNEENQPLVTHGPVEVQDSMKITYQFREIHREPEISHIYLKLVKKTQKITHVTDWTLHTTITL